MKLGTRFPQGLIGLDVGAVRDYVQGLEELGFDYLETSDHVLLPDIPEDARDNLPGAGYTLDSAMREPFVLLAYVAALTARMELVTSIIILPQRQTVLVAKQAAELDALSGGRLRLGVGLGRIEMEYEALRQDFHTRGKRLEEQVKLLRLLWTEKSVDFHGRWESVSSAGINPLPVQRPIPIWMGGGVGRGGIVPAALQRVARLADGWCPLPAANPEMMAEARDTLRSLLVGAGRDPAAFPIEMRTTCGGPDDWAAQYKAEEKLGTDYFTVVPAGIKTGVDAHLSALSQFRRGVS
ncbi:MAG TPA: LLM class F420-dependent oxidoreductase [Dehalococcoidia bacterium]|nr:LLM class F420-dependent oxidoreductase [Dehalococcoidia bacterium]